MEITTDEEGNIIEVEYTYEDKMKHESEEKRIESPDYPESKEEWEECGWDIDKEEQKLKSEDKRREECEDEINKLTKEEYLKSEDKQ